MTPRFLCIAKESKTVDLKIITNDNGTPFPDQKARSAFITDFYESLYKNQIPLL